MRQGISMGRLLAAPLQHSRHSPAISVSRGIRRFAGERRFQSKVIGVLKSPGNPRIKAVSLYALSDG
jgi:hypothetical protein